MSSRILPVVGVSAVALAVATSFAPIASAHSTHFSSSHQSATAAIKASPAKSKACYTNKGPDASFDVVSQNFTEAGDDAYDSQGADDLTIKKTCKVGEVDVVGAYFNGTGPAKSETVTFYQNKKNAPGKVVGTATAKGKDAGGKGSFAIALKKPITLKAGTYWLSVQVNMDGTVGGEWGWDTTTKQTGKPALWQNPGDAFATGCTTYKNMNTCLGDQGEGPDFIFTVSK